MGEFDISYRPRTAIKGQVLADLVVDFTEESPNGHTMGLLDKGEDYPPLWQLWVDGATNKNGSGAGIVMTTPVGDKICCSVSFGFAS